MPDVWPVPMLVRLPGCRYGQPGGRPRIDFVARALLLNLRSGTLNRIMISGSQLQASPLEQPGYRELLGQQHASVPPPLTGRSRR
jgi:hypothetical protein